MYLGMEQGIDLRHAESEQHKSNTRFSYKRLYQHALSSWKPTLPPGIWGCWGNPLCTSFGATSLLYFTQILWLKENVKLLYHAVSSNKWAERGSLLEKGYTTGAYIVQHVIEGQTPRYLRAGAHLKILCMAEWSTQATQESLRNKWVPRRLVVGISLLFFLRLSLGW